MKKLFSVVAQFVLFLVADALGSLFYQPFHLRTTLSGSPAELRLYVWDGVILMLLAYAAVLLIGALRRRFGASAPWATLALVLAAAGGFALRLGFVTQDR